MLRSAAVAAIVGVMVLVVPAAPAMAAHFTFNADPGAKSFLDALDEDLGNLFDKLEIPSLSPPLTSIELDDTITHAWKPEVDYWVSKYGGPWTPKHGPCVVPEPATWALMMMAFAALGTSLRRRRAV